MAAVYLARSRGVGGFEREVAIKLTHAHLRDIPEFSTDLIDEAKLAVRIRHPNVVPIIDVGEGPDGVYLVMEYIEGDSLAGLMRRAYDAGQAMPPRIAMRVLLDALAGLHAAHELRDEAGRPLGIVHRDFSPQNVLVGVDGVARLADFGIARAAGRIGQTKDGTVKGKIVYMSPEQARMLPLDRRCDVWAAGVVAWELLAGNRIYGVENEIAMLLKIVTEAPPRVRTVAPHIGEALDAAVAHALTIDREQRTPSAAAMARELTQACLAQGAVAETEEVAAYVLQVVGPRLARRRERIADSAMMRTAAVFRGAEGSIEIPSDISDFDVGDEPESTAPILVTDSPSFDEPLPLPTGPALEAPSAPISQLPPMPEPARTDTLSVSTSSQAAPRKGTSASRVVFATALAGTILVASALLVTNVQKRVARARPLAPLAASPSSAPTTSSEPSSALVAVPPATATSPSSPIGLHLHANDAVSLVRIGERTVRFLTPTRDPIVELSDEEQHHDLSLRAVSVRGQQTSIALPSGATTAVVTFAPRPAAALRASASPSAAIPPRPPPLAGSPY